MPDATSLDGIREIADEAIGAVVSDCDSVALVGFPDHSNVGDSAIWLGELAYLKAQSVRVGYSCSSDSYRRENLARHTASDAPILIHGGGYFGDVWPTGLEYMLRVVADFPDRSIIVMPQTVHFASQARLERARRIINGHGSMTLCVRDERSASLAHEYFDHPIVLSPDSAVFLEMETARHGDGILCLAREDREARANHSVAAMSGIATTDWVNPPTPGMPARLLLPALFRTKARLHRHVGASDSSEWQERIAAATRDALARHRLQRGRCLLESAEVVVTDRLHAHILSVLLGLPHIVLDNSYGKVRAYYETWSQGLACVDWASNPEQALTMAEALLEQASRTRCPPK